MLKARFVGAPLPNVTLVVVVSYLRRTQCSGFVWQSRVSESLLPLPSLLLMCFCSSWKGICDRITSNSPQGYCLLTTRMCQTLLGAGVRDLTEALPQPSDVYLTTSALQRNRGSESLSNFPNVAQLASGRGEMVGQPFLTLMTTSAQSLVICHCP